MKTSRMIVSLVAVAVLLVVGLVMAQVADWMPKGGKTLLVQVLDNCKDCDNIAAIAAAGRTQDQWREYFTKKQPKGAAQKTGALAGLTEKQIKTLVAYLATNMPMQKNEIPQDPDKLKKGDFLPPQGSQMALDACGACHPPTPILLLQHSEQEWYSFLAKQEHADFITPFGFKEKQLRTISGYLTINMPMPEKEIPESLREAWANYK